MGGPRASLIRDVQGRAAGDLLLAIALIALVLVPLPAVFAALRAPLSAAHLRGVMPVLAALVAASPLCALPPFVVGCGIGTLAHLALTSRERLAIAEAGGHPSVSKRALVASSLLVGGIFAATGLLGATLIFGLA